MPLRNLMIIAIAGMISLACYFKIEHNRDAAIIAETISTIEDYYYEPIDRRTLFEGAMQGLVNQLDQNSAYFPPKEYQSLDEGLNQQFGGIGIVVELGPVSETDPAKRRLTVLSPLVGTPAHEAGMRAGDTILEIDGHSTEGMSLKDAVELMRGERGEEVGLLVRHIGSEETVVFNIKRDIIPVESVLGDTRRANGSWNFFLEDHPRIGYIRLTTFGKDTATELESALDYSGHPIDALIIDVRGNAGGYLKTAVDVARLFIDSGDIVTTKGRSGVVTPHTYKANASTKVDPDVPMVIMTNRFSASASEIVSACLQDHGRAIVVGERTWGKGTVQNIVEMEGGTSALKLTTATYWRPSGKDIHRRRDAKDEDEWGVTPNEGFDLRLSDEEFEKVLKQRRRRDFINIGGAENNLEGEDGEEDEDFEDPQLKKAVEYLERKIRSVPSRIEKV